MYNNGNDCDNIGLNKILYDYHKMDFIFYYYVKIYFYLNLYIPSIWSWVVINNFYKLFGIIACILWVFRDGMLLYNVDKSDSRSY